MAKILVVDDEKLIVKGIRFSLEQDGMEVDCAFDGEEAINLAKQTEYDVVLLDVMLPKHDGFEVCQAIREFSEMPIIMLTAKGGDMDKILGLEYGADDYVTKPFNPVELLARVRSQLRRYMKLGGSPGASEKNSLRVGPFELDDKTKTLTQDGEPVVLTPTEYRIMQLFMSRPGEVLSPKEIYRQVWKDEPFGSDSTVAVHIRHLREKLEINPAEPRYLKVVWAQGYKLCGDR